MIQYEVQNNRLSAEEIKKILEMNEVQEDIKRRQANMRYFKGDNPFIKDRKPPDTNSPDNRIPIPYARKIINTVTGYMYKPGLITYASENEKYLDIINEVFEFNDEPIESSQLGGQTSIQGVGFELHYIDAADEDGARIAMPRFTKIAADQMIALYDYSIEPQLTIAMRHYVKGEDYWVHVYYSDVVQDFVRTKQNKNFELAGEYPHFYGRVPVVVYQNNEEQIGDFEPVKYLIDAYDSLMSGCMNEVDRFAWAYLLIAGRDFDERDVDNLKHGRTIGNLEKADDVRFLVKDANPAFLQFMAEWIRKEIHKQSHVPDFLDSRTGDVQSGIAISKLLYDFEFIAATKEAYFRRALTDRLEMIDSIIRIRDGGLVGDKDDIDIILSRNKPMDLKENAEVFQMLSGQISKQTLIENLISFVDDAQEEIDRLREEEDAQAQIDLDNFEQRQEVFAKNMDDGEQRPPETN